ncbi:MULTISPECIES: AAA family ATPase [Paraburkholderia]|uniref:AAA family ATPase n=1 Tax=Paraburkholderia podalyriae TaxID=1938811 RepID=A0ABR7PHC1_9BURK|nr:AAA family ATPase [Paraburkholderia podalyriae]MBC8745209.1 AAA family ATPase [Paraburkholderia podalyriae]
MISNANDSGETARPQPESATMLDHALAYAARGMRVLPLEPKGKAPLGRLVPNGKNDATCAPEIIKRWWGAVPDANIGINCAASGIVIVDIDCHEGKSNGYETLATLELEHGPLPSTAVAKSGSGGEHRYYRVSDGGQLPGKLGPGVDLKHNGHIVASPSIHANGTPYSWMPGCSVFDALDMPVLPVWVYARRPERKSAPMSDSDRLPVEVARACSALFALNAGCDRDTWIRLGMAAKDAGVPFEVFDAWSATGANYTREDDCRAAWDSFKDDRAVRVTAATLFHEAKKAGWIDSAKAPDAHETDVERYRVLSADDLANAPPLRWLVRGVLPASGLASIYGPSGSGKSFLALDLCAAIAGGEDWFGRRVDAAPVLYVCLEGEAGLSKRVSAWREHHGRVLPERMGFITQSFDLRSPADVDALCAAVSAAGLRDGLLVIDTLNRAAPGADENASTDMGALIEACKEIQRVIGGVVLAVHHTGKDAAKGLRGHSSLFAALDAAIEVKRDGDRREFHVAKSKDDVDGARNPFRLQPVELGDDAEGEPVTSCVVEPDDSEAPAPVRRLGPTQKIVHDVLQMLLRESPHSGEAGAPAGQSCVREADVVPVIAERLSCDPTRRNTMVRRALNDFCASRIVHLRDGWIWAV